jgi:adenylate kinase
MPPKVDGICDKCGSKLIQRTDDSESVVERRLQIFREQNDQILDYYRQQTNLLELNADAEVEKVFSTLKKSLS